MTPTYSCFRWSSGHSPSPSDRSPILRSIHDPPLDLQFLRSISDPPARSPILPLDLRSYHSISDLSAWLPISLRAVSGILPIPARTPLRSRSPRAQHPLIRHSDHGSDHRSAPDTWYTWPDHENLSEQWWTTRSMSEIPIWTITYLSHSRTASSGDWNHRFCPLSCI